MFPPTRKRQPFSTLRRHVMIFDVRNIYVLPPTFSRLQIVKTPRSCGENVKSAHAQKRAYVLKETTHTQLTTRTEA